MREEKQLRIAKPTPARPRRAPAPEAPEEARMHQITFCVGCEEPIPVHALACFRCGTRQPHGERALQVVQVEERLGLEVQHLGLGGAVRARQLLVARQQPVAVLDGLLVLAELLDQELGAVQVAGDELGVGLERALELEQRLLRLALVPQDLAAAVVRLGAFGMRLDGLIQERQRGLGAAFLRGLHRLVEVVPVAVLVLHSLSRRLAQGRKARRE